MTNRYLPLVLTLPLAFLGVFLALREDANWSGVVAIVAALTALPVLCPLWPGGRIPLAFPALVLVLAVGVDGFLTGSAPGGVLADVIVGLLVGAPLWAAGLIAGVVERPGLSIALLAELLGVVVLLDATDTSLAGPVGTVGYSSAWLGVINEQVGGLAKAISTGGLSSPIIFPTATIWDPVLLLTGLLALAAVLFPMFPPAPSGRLPPAAVPRRDLAPPVRIVPPPVLNPPDTTPTTPRPSPGPTLAPVAGAIIAVAGFEILAAGLPKYSFLVVSVAAAAALLALVLVASRGVPRGGPAPVTGRSG